MSYWARLGAFLAVTTLVLDQAVKALFLYGLDFMKCAPCLDPAAPCQWCEPLDVMPFFNIVMVWNRGVSFGLFSADSSLESWLLTAFSVGMSIVLGVWLRRASDRFLCLGLGLVIGGALGNVIDRVIHGAVADFFQFHAFGWSWYVFNVADAAIVVGVLMIILDAFVARQRAPADAPNG